MQERKRCLRAFDLHQLLQQTRCELADFLRQIYFEILTVLLPFEQDVAEIIVAHQVGQPGITFAPSWFSNRQRRNCIFGARRRHDVAIRIARQRECMTLKRLSLRREAIFDGKEAVRKLLSRSLFQLVELVFDFP